MRGFLQIIKAWRDCRAKITISLCLFPPSFILPLQQRGGCALSRSHLLCHSAPASRLQYVTSNRHREARQRIPYISFVNENYDEKCFFNELFYTMKMRQDLIGEAMQLLPPSPHSRGPGSRPFHNLFFLFLPKILLSFFSTP